MSYKDEIYKYINSLKRKPYYNVMVKTVDDMEAGGTFSSDYSYINFLKCLKELKRNLENNFFETPKRITYNFSKSHGEFQLIDNDNFWYGTIACWDEDKTEARHFVRK